ncbi:MAG TPA: zinc-binding dehydrogenase [Candidatus Eremiobacteraceae bacterium]|jgi:NADPH:quinone reductase-like Zn-dependent oxidoreductase
MRAVFATQLGGDNPLENLEVGERPEPALGPGDVRIRVRAATLNHHDLFTLRGIVGYPVTVPRILGTDAAGTVLEYGPGRPADSPDPGTDVTVYPVVFCGSCAACRGADPMLCKRFVLLSDGDREGSFAEQLVVPAHCVFKKPAAFSFAQAASLGTTYLTAYRMLFIKAALAPGAAVLIQGASGGLATAAIQLARAAGITVIASSRTQAKLDAAAAAGAHHGVIAGRDAAKSVHAICPGGVDAVIESVGEPTWATSLRALREGGAIVVAGATAGPNPSADLARVFWRQLRVFGSTMGTPSEFAALLRFVDRAAIAPIVDTVYPAGEARAAFARLTAGDFNGKLALSFE